MKSFDVISSLIEPGIRGILPRVLESLWSLISMLGLLSSIVLCLVFEVKASENVCNLALPALSIFTALVFSVIFTVPSQLEQRLKTFEAIVDEPTINYLIRYRNFVQKFTRQLISICFSCIVLIVCILPQSFISATIAQILTGVMISFTIELILLFISTTINLSKLIQESISFSTELIYQKKKQLQVEDDDD